MVRTKRLKILGEGVSYPKLSEINLRWIIKKEDDKDEILKFLAHNGLLKNKRECKKCLKPMSLVKKKGISDGIRWQCPSCASAKTVRQGSMFSGSKLLIVNLLILLYMWTNDYQNKYASAEAGVDSHVVGEWFLKFRRVTRE